MSLRDRLKAKKAPESTLTIADERFKVVGRRRSEREEMLSEARAKSSKAGKKAIDGYELEGRLLSYCVRDPDDGSEVFSVDEWREWDAVYSNYTGPLMAEVMRLNGMDNEDVGREVKNSDTTAGSA